MTPACHMCLCRSTGPGTWRGIGIRMHGRRERSPARLQPDWLTTPIADSSLKPRSEARINRTQASVPGATIRGDFRPSEETMRYVAVWCGALFAVTSLGAQAPAELRFDAATIKPVAEPTGRGPQGVGVFGRNYITLQNLLVYAYDLPSFRIVGGAGWLTSDHFDVLAKTSARPTTAQTRVMLQQLLAERFRLKVHREQRALPTFDLVMAR